MIRARSSDEEDYATSWKRERAPEQKKKKKKKTPVDKFECHVGRGAGLVEEDWWC